MTLDEFKNLKVGDLVEDKDNAITPEEIYGWITKYQKDCDCFELYNNAPEIASLYMDLINSQIELNGFIDKYCSKKQMAEFTGRNIIRNIMDAYLNLHEENQCLQVDMEKSTELAMRAIHASLLENARLQKENETLQNALMAEEEEVRRLREALEEIAHKALKNIK